MRTEDNDQSAERWLDAALKQYGEAEPRPGLENRMLANLQAERARLTLRVSQDPSLPVCRMVT